MKSHISVAALISVAGLLVACESNSNSQSRNANRNVTTRAEADERPADFPHGQNQFISSAATNWATRALLLDLP